MQCQKVTHDPTTALQNICERNVIFLDVMSAVWKMINQCFRRLYHLQAAVFLEMMVTTNSLHSSPIPENCSLIFTSVNTQILWERTFHFVQTKRNTKKTCILLWNPYLWFIMGAEDLKIKVMKMVHGNNLTQIWDLTWVTMNNIWQKILNKHYVGGLWRQKHTWKLTLIQITIINLLTRQNHENKIKSRTGTWTYNCKVRNTKM